MMAIPGSLLESSAMEPAAWSEVETLPARMPWRKLREEFIDSVHSHFEMWITPEQKHFATQLSFAIGRFDEGMRLLLDLRRHILGRRDAELRILDVGSGNGGLAFAFANDPRNKVYGIDVVPNPQAAYSKRRLSSPARFIVADGAKLPVASGSFDLVLLIDVLEHLAEPLSVAREMMRVLRPGGFCVVVTPARLAHIVRPDPHYGVRGLLMLPNGVQRWLVDEVFRRRIATATGGRAKAYDVTHTYWHAGEIARLFPEPKTVDVLYDRQFSPPPPSLRHWLEHPKAIVEWWRFRTRRFFFGHILVYRGCPADGTPSYDRMR